MVPDAKEGIGSAAETPKAYLERWIRCLDRWEREGDETGLQEAMCAWLFGHLDACNADHGPAVLRLRTNLAALIVVAGRGAPAESWGEWRSSLDSRKARQILSSLIVPKLPRGKPQSKEQRERAAVIDSYRENPDLTKKDGEPLPPEQIDQLLTDDILPRAAKMFGWSIDLDKDVGFHADSVGRGHRRRRGKKQSS